MSNLSQSLVKSNNIYKINRNPTSYRSGVFLCLKINNMDGRIVRKLGSEKLTYFEDNFDEVVDGYKMKAENEGYYGKLLFNKEKGKMVIFVTLEEDE